MKISNGKEYIEFVVGQIFNYDNNHKDFELCINANVSFMNIKYFTYSSLFAFKELYKNINNHYKSLDGSFKIDNFSYENDFDIKMEFDKLGHINIEMNIKSNNEHSNKCSLRFYSDQTFISNFLKELKDFIEQN